MTLHDFYPGDRVKWKRKLGQTAEGVVIERGATRGKRYIVVNFNKPMSFKKKFENDNIKQLKRS